MWCIGLHGLRRREGIRMAKSGPRRVDARRMRGNGSVLLQHLFHVGHAIDQHLFAKFSLLVQHGNLVHDIDAISNGRQRGVLPESGDDGFKLNHALGDGLDQQLVGNLHARLCVQQLDMGQEPIGRGHDLLGRRCSRWADMRRSLVLLELEASEELLDVPDHVTHELEFMYFLAFNEAATGDSSWAERQVCFWREHLRLWLPRFADAVTRAGIHPVYDGLAQILSWLCALQDAQQGPADPAPSTSRGSASNAHLSSIC